MDNIISNIVRSAVKNENIFDDFVKKISYTPTSLKDMKIYTKKVGDMWEKFCAIYLEKIHRMKVFTLKNCPLETLNLLHMKRQDVGIDLIALDENDNYIAIQCKYRKTCKTLSWRDVATFDALCMRTGPWHKCIVMTTSRFLKREGLSRNEDIFWGKTHFARLEKHEWLIIGHLGNGNCCGGQIEDDVNKARLKYFEKKKPENK